MRMFARLVLALALAIVATLAAVALPAIKPQPASAAGADYFAETSHTLGGPIRSAWQAGGGVWMYGFPISEPMRWSTDADGTVIAQYFERARLEYHPEYEGTPNRVLGGLLGTDLTQGRREESAFLAAGPSSSGDCAYQFPTNHNLCSHFRAWWERRGGLPVFGYPISEPFIEGGFEVQYFERARFEHHPEFAGTNWEVALGHLGSQDASRRGLTGSASFERVEAVSVNVRVDSPLLSAASGGEQLAMLPAGTAVAVVGGPSWDSYQVKVNGVTGWIAAGDLNWNTSADPRAAQTLPLWMADAALDARAAEISPYVSIAIYDPLTNQLFEGGTSGPVAAASLAKVLLMAVTLKQAEHRGETSATAHNGALTVMIEFSDNDAADDIWSVIGGADGLQTFLRDEGLSGFIVPHQFDWGEISATAGDWARFFGLLGSGQLLNPANTDYALNLMKAVLSEQRFGVAAPGEDRLSIGKNGWYLDEGPVFQWRVNSAGLVDSAEGPPGVAPLAVVMLSRVPGEYGMDWGAAAGREVQDAAIRYASQRWAEYHARSEHPAPVKLAAQGGSVTSISTYVTSLSHALIAWGP